MAELAGNERSQRKLQTSPGLRLIGINGRVFISCSVRASERALADVVIIILDICLLIRPGVQSIFFKSR
jgi:hypothetical protein